MISQILASTIVLSKYDSRLTQLDLLILEFTQNMGQDPTKQCIGQEAKGILRERGLI